MGICFMDKFYRDEYEARLEKAPLARAKGRGSLAHADGIGVILTDEERRNTQGIVF
jgi:hypothetical protein